MIDERQSMKLKIVAALQQRRAFDLERALTLWQLSSCVDVEGERIPVRFIARMVAVLVTEGAINEETRRDESSVYWLARPTAFLESQRSSLDEAHEQAETQLPTQDSCVTEHEEES